LWSHHFGIEVSFSEGITPMRNILQILKVEKST
jgi:hypothetical protein